MTPRRVPEWVLNALAMIVAALSVAYFVEVCRG